MSLPVAWLDAVATGCKARGVDLLLHELSQGELDLLVLIHEHGGTAERAAQQLARRRGGAA